jgi:predicted nucleic acid-binding protein
MRLLGLARRAVLLGDPVGAGGLVLKAALLERGVLEHLDGLRHAADLVIAAHGRHVGIGVATREARHRLAQAPEAPREAEHHHARQAADREKQDHPDRS